MKAKGDKGANCSNWYDDMNNEFSFKSPQTMKIKIKIKKATEWAQGSNFRNPLFRKVFLEEEKGYALVLLTGHMWLC